MERAMASERAWWEAEGVTPDPALRIAAVCLLIAAAALLPLPAAVAAVWCGSTIWLAVDINKRRCHG